MMGVNNSSADLLSHLQGTHKRKKIFETSEFCIQDSYFETPSEILDSELFLKVSYYPHPDDF